MSINREILNNFTVDTLPDLDVVVLGALELLADTDLPTIEFSHFKKPLVLGSVNAYKTAQMFFQIHRQYLPMRVHIMKCLRKLKELTG